MDRDATGESAAPVPVSATTCGLLPASSVKVTEALRVPVAVGEKMTATVQFAPAVSVEVLAGQLLVCEKSPLFVPVTAMLEIVSAAFPVFVKVTFCEALVVPTGWLEKVNGAESVATGATPVPVNEMLCGLLAASSEIDTAEIRVPDAVGLKVTLIAQFALIARLAPQLLVCE